MKFLWPILGSLLLLLAHCPAQVVEETRLDALRQADDARVVATIAVNHDALAGLLSDDLHYAHASGAVDTKTSLIEALSSGRLKYSVMSYLDRVFTFPVPSISLMTGRVHLQVVTPTGPVESDMSYLAVWREEAGQWRLLAWQSSRLNPPPAAK